MVERTCDKENKGVSLSKCCREYFDEILTDEGELKICCGKCGKVCITLKEKYSIKNFDIFVAT